MAEAPGAAKPARRNPSGGCDLEVTVKESVIGDVSGGVGLKVRGNPPKSRVHTGGGASVD